MPNTGKQRRQGINWKPCYSDYLKSSALSHVVSYMFCWIQHWPMWIKVISESRTGTGLSLWQDSSRSKLTYYLCVVSNLTLSNLTKLLSNLTTLSQDN